MAEPFNQRFIKQVQAELRKQALEHMDTIALLSHSFLVQSTPVDLGQARAGWNFSKNKLDKTVPEKPARGTTLAPPPVAKPNARNWNDRYHISNFVAHIVFLNEGSSEQAPAKFVERDIKRAVKLAEAGRR